MTSPFRIAGPALISFSGGRTSAYMLHEIVQAHGGTLPKDVLVTFANTGREMPETLDFVYDCSRHFGVEIVWLEYDSGQPSGRRFRQVTFESASRDSEPFDDLIARKKYLSNVVTRFCTTELKIHPMRDYARSLGWDHWTNVVGLRADEQHRVANIKAGAGRERWEVETPLHRAGITKRDVAAFWLDCCFLKGEATIVGIMRQRPERGQWWADKERETGGTWSKRTSHTALFAFSRQPTLLDFLPSERIGDCYCTGDE